MLLEFLERQFWIVYFTHKLINLERLNLIRFFIKQTSKTQIVNLVLSSQVSRGRHSADGDRENGA